MWDHGGGHIGLSSSLGLVPNYVVLVLGNAGWGSHHMQGHHTRDLWINLRKLVVLTLFIHQIFNQVLPFTPVFSPKTNMIFQICTT